MPHKSKHKQQFRKQPIAAPVATAAVTTAPGAAPSVTPAPMVKAAAAKPRAGTNPQSLAPIGVARYPFLTSEMKWIGIFALIIIVIMAILKVILPLFIK